MGALLHTPAPWVFEENEHSLRMEIRMGESVEGASYRVSHKPLELPELYPEDGAQYEEMMANGRLMSAAPDLLTALLFVMGSALVTNDEHNPWTCNEASCEMARDAIAKARVDA